MNVLHWLSPYRSSDSMQADPIARLREVILQYTLYILVIVGIGGFIYAFPGINNSEFVGLLTLSFTTSLVLLVMAFVRAIPYAIRASVTVLMIYGVAVQQLVSNGVLGSGLVLLFMAVILANLLFNSWVGGSAMLVATGTVVYIAAQMVSGQIPVPTITDTINPANVSAWAYSGSTLFVGTLITATGFMVLINGIHRILDRQAQLTHQIEEHQSSLEIRVQERSADLQKKLSQFEVANEIAREISAQMNLEDLLENAVNLVRDRFGFYHAGIFLSDERNEYAVLRAATGQAGRQMLDRNHRLKIGEIGIVGYVVSKGEARISMNVADDLIHYKNPLLPNTRSEMGLPLIVNGQVIGALDVQSVEENAFAQDEVKILQAVADQLALAVDKTLLVDRLQRNVEDLEASHTQATRQTWQGYLKSARRRFSYRYRQSLLDYDAPETEQGQQALTTGKPVISVSTDPETGKQSRVLAVPIKLRNQVLGVVDIHFEGVSVSSDLISLIEGTIDRLAVSLENARLLEEIQYRAERERLVGEISTRVRSASDIDSILRIAAQEIGRSLGVSEVMVQLRNVEHA